jgi:hypothetical protein
MTFPPLSREEVRSGRGSGRGVTHGGSTTPPGTARASQRGEAGAVGPHSDATAPSGRARRTATRPTRAPRARGRPSSTPTPRARRTAAASEGRARRPNVQTPAPRCSDAAPGHLTRLGRARRVHLGSGRAGAIGRHRQQWIRRCVGLAGALGQLVPCDGRRPGAMAQQRAHRTGAAGVHAREETDVGARGCNVRRLDPAGKPSVLASVPGSSAAVETSVAEARPTAHPARRATPTTPGAGSRPRIAACPSSRATRRTDR